MHSGKQSPAYFGTIPRTRLFLGVLILSAQREEKNNLKVKEKKKQQNPIPQDKKKQSKRLRERQDNFLFNFREHSK